MNQLATLELIEERTFTARLHDRNVTGLAVESAWEGFTKFRHGASGLHLIVLDAEKRVVSGSPSLMSSLGLVAAEHFVTVPETILPTGQVIPAFQVGQYHCSKNDQGAAIVNATGKPWVSVNYHDARAASLEAGASLITELQCLAIAHNIAQQGINWSGGKVGSGTIYQGIRSGSVSGPQAGTYEPNESERRWHELSNGVRIYDFAGNVFTWVFDDVQGDADGLVNGSIAKDSPSLTCAPAPSGEKGVGYIPSGPLNWSGVALVRGGCWCSGSYAGVFYLNLDWPDYGYYSVGFRCTKPIGL